MFSRGDDCNVDDHSIFRSSIISTMDSTTLAYYSSHAKDVAQRYENAPSSLAGRFSSSFVSGGRILDIGCGSGRDMAELARRGFQPYP
jgi:2-polyprenyl-3-methyl-5-hydroxy-6-metoxy-1,4-benzoquinol methylase